MKHLTGYVLMVNFFMAFFFCTHFFAVYLGIDMWISFLLGGVGGIAIVSTVTILFPLLSFILSGIMFSYACYEISGFFSLDDGDRSLIALVSFFCGALGNYKFSQMIGVKLKNPLSYFHDKVFARQKINELEYKRLELIWYINLFLESAGILNKRIVERTHQLLQESQKGVFMREEWADEAVDRSDFVLVDSEIFEALEWLEELGLLTEHEVEKGRKKALKLGARPQIS